MECWPTGSWSKDKDGYPIPMVSMTTHPTPEEIARRPVYETRPATEAEIKAAHGSRWRGREEEEESVPAAVAG